jgi:hypothetical protein
MPPFSRTCAASPHVTPSGSTSCSTPSSPFTPGM